MFDNLFVIVCLLVIAAASLVQLYLNWATVRRMGKDVKGAVKAGAQAVKDRFPGKGKTEDSES